MKAITMKYGPFDPNEIAFYERELCQEGNLIINAFQQDLIFNLFYKYFGDPVSLNAINKNDYIKLMITARRILEVSGMLVLPYIISSRVFKLVTRKNINKKELLKLESSENFSKIKEKYKNPKLEKHILGIIAQMIASSFQIIDYEDEEMHGKLIEKIPEFICEEVLMYISLI